MNCPNCNSPDFYEGFLSKECWKKGCVWYTAKAEELRKKSQPKKEAEDDTLPGGWTNFKRSEMYNDPGTHNRFRLTGDGNYEVQWHVGSDQRHTNRWGKRNVLRSVESKEWYLTDKLFEDFLAEHYGIAQSQVALKSSAPAAPKAAAGIYKISTGWANPPPVFLNPQTFEALKAYNVGVSGSVPSSGVGIESKADATKLEFTREEFREAVRLACEAGVEHYMDLSSTQNKAGRRGAYAGLVDSIGKSTNVAWENVAAKASLKTARHPVAEECQACARWGRRVRLGVGGNCPECGYY